jgi:hypothetical protein
VGGGGRKKMVNAILWMVAAEFPDPSQANKVYKYFVIGEDE